MPNATREISLDIEKDLQPKVASGAISLHVAALIEYEYAKDGRGEYVISSQYNFNTGANAIDYEWSK
ncbi:MAG: hypothetical protein ACRD5H_06995 [Nitrososphaerales archaeon]